MDSSKNGDTAVQFSMSELKAKAEGEAVAGGAPSPVAAARAGRGGWKKGLAGFDFLLRLLATGAALAAATTMGATDQTLPFFIWFFQFQASYDDLPAVSGAVVASFVAALIFIFLVVLSAICLERK